MGEVTYPRVLVFGGMFGRSGGGAITLGNLFQGWPRDRLAVASQLAPTDGRICGRYYRLGDKEVSRLTPTGRKPVPYRSQAIEIDADYAPETTAGGKPGRSLKSSLRGALLNTTGLVHCMQRSRLSEDFRRWVREFNPDVLYAQFSTLNQMLFIEQMLDEFDLPLVIHMMDDWITSLPLKSRPNWYWRRRLESPYRRIVRRAKVRLAICDGMAREYERRYGAPFIGFHNPVDLTQWTPHTKTDVRIEGPCRILYAGSVNFFILGALKDMAQAVGELRGEGLDIELHVYSSNLVTSDADEKLSALARLDGVERHPGVPFAGMPHLLASHDILTIPFDFSRKNLVFTRFSMPTKTSEFMISGSPMLVYAPGECSLVEYAREQGFAEVVSQRGAEALKPALRRLTVDNALRETLSRRAVELAKTHHDAAAVRGEFLQRIIQATE